MLSLSINQSKKDVAKRPAMNYSQIEHKRKGAEKHSVTRDYTHPDVKRARHRH